MSILNKMLEKYNDRATFVSFTRDSRAGLMHFRDEFDFDYHIIPEAAGAFEAYGVDEGPVHVLIDRNGKVVFAFQGTRSHLDRWIGARIDSAYHLGK